MKGTVKPEWLWRGICSCVQNKRVHWDWPQIFAPKELVGFHAVDLRSTDEPCFLGIVVRAERVGLVADGWTHIRLAPVLAVSLDRMFRARATVGTDEVLLARDACSVVRDDYVALRFGYVGERSPVVWTIKVRD